MSRAYTTESNTWVQRTDEFTMTMTVPYQVPYQVRFDQQIIECLACHRPWEEHRGKHRRGKGRRCPK